MHKNFQKITTIAFDADDTLWVNEPYFRATEEAFCQMLSHYTDAEEVSTILFSMQMRNLELYGYGVKAFTLSMIETLSKVSKGQASLELVDKTLVLGKTMLQQPIELLDGVKETLATLQQKYRLVIATKGDLLDQERKLLQSGLAPYFHHIEVMSYKKEADYQKLLQHLDCQAQDFLMVGNSLKSDVLPVLEIGAHAIHIPFYSTWIHEQIDFTVEHPNFKEVEKMSDLLELLV